MGYMDKTKKSSPDTEARTKNAPERNPKADWYFYRCCLSSLCMSSLCIHFGI